MDKQSLGKVVMWCSGIIAAVTLVLYFGAKRESEQAIIPEDFDAGPYWIVLGICAVGFMAGTIYAALGDREH